VSLHDLQIGEPAQATNLAANTASYRRGPEQNLNGFPWFMDSPDLNPETANTL